LKNKAFEAGKVVIDACEAYTSKTNAYTGELNLKLDSSRTIKVGEHRIDRDINGARGIMIKWLSENPLALGDTPFGLNTFVA
jgi:putative transposase